MLSVCVRDRRRRSPRRQLPPRPLRCTIRFQQVQPLVDTGMTARQQTLLQQRARSYFRVHSDEIFGRINVDKLVTLIVDCQRLNHQPTSPRAHDSHCETPQLRPPYLLLDVRDLDEYRRSHIVTARHFSPHRLSRTVQFDTEQLRFHRNRAESVIIVYDSGEAESARCATVLCQRGYDNVFVLSGGLRLALDLIPAVYLMTGRDQAADDVGEQELAGLEKSLQQLAVDTGHVGVASGPSLSSLAARRQQAAASVIRAVKSRSMSRMSRASSAVSVVSSCRSRNCGSNCGGGSTAGLETRKPAWK